MADMTSPLTRFCAENYPLMKLLDPFFFYNDAKQAKILESAWTKLGGKNKHFYVNLLKDELSNGNTKYLAMQHMREVIASQDAKDDAFEIYRTEMRLILLQDPRFVKDHYHELRDVIKKGWNVLKDEQRFHFYERVILAKEDGYTENPYQKQIPVIGGKIFACGPRFLERNYLNTPFGIGLNQNRKTEWTSHYYTGFTNTIDSAAFEEFANVVHAEEPSLAGNVIWVKWMNLKNKKREPYYRKAFETAALIDAETLFVQEKQTVVRCNGYDRKAYSAEQMELQKAWNDISEEAKKVYIDKALSYYLERDQNPETRFVGMYNYNKDKLMPRVTTIDDVNSELTPLLPLNYVLSDVEKDVFIVYMEKERPLLLKHPKVVQKRFWEVNLILWNQWRTGGEPEQQPYYDLVRRFLEIRRKLMGWKLEAWQVFGDGYEYRYQFAKLDAETKKRYGEIALQNRKTLLKNIPDLYDYYYWIKREPNMGVDVSVSTSSSHLLVDAVENATKNVSQQQGNAYSPKYEYLMYTDASDVEAFQEYQKSVDAVVFTYTNVWWNQFVNLNDEERNVYYDKAIKTAAAKQGCILFASENCTVIKQSEEDDAFANEVLRLNETWKNLCGSAKNHYFELAEKNLRKREKEKPEDYHFKNNGVHYCNIDNDNIRCNEQLVPKYSQMMYNVENPEKNALTVYMKKHFTELYNQPGMAEKRYFQLCLILEERFMDLSDEERQIYLDIVRMINRIKFEIQNLPVTTKDVYYQKHMTLQHWRKASDEEKAVCEEEAKQNLKTLMKKYPALTEHYHWMVYGQTSTESQAETVTNVKTVAMDAPTVTNETTTETESNGTQESVYAEIVKDKTLPHVVEEVKYVSPNLGFDGHVETLANTIEQAITAETHKQKNDSVELDSAKLQDPILNATTSKESESTVIWKAVDDKKNTREEAPLKSTEEPQRNAYSAQATKTPTAFMFYKKAMRRNNADQNFGKKDNESQRTALIAGWKKLSDEEKAVYFKMENRARAEAQLLQLL